MLCSFSSAGDDARATGWASLPRADWLLPGRFVDQLQAAVGGAAVGSASEQREWPVLVQVLQFDLRHPRLLGLYQPGDVMLDELITRTYTLDEINEGYADLEAGKLVRGVIVHELRRHDRRSSAPPGICPSRAAASIKRLTSAAVTFVHHGRARLG